MTLHGIIVAIGAILAVACAGSAPKRDSSGLVALSSWKPGELYSHPARSIDDYDDILVGEVGLSYAAKQQALTADDQQRLKMGVFEIVGRQIPAAGQLAVSSPGPCTVTLGVQLADLTWPTANHNGGTTVILEFRDSLNGDPIVRYTQHRELSNIGPTTASGPDLKRLGATLEVVAEDVRLRLRDVLPLNRTGARAGQGCKGVIGEVRKASKEAKK
jgi:hypothetical protein